METSSRPDQIPAMHLSDTVFFPSSVLPLYIFEPQYRKMLEDVIETHRMFTILSISPEILKSDPGMESEVVTLGMVKACQTYDNGTSMVLLEGVRRAFVEEVIQTTPYPLLKISNLDEEPTDPITLKNCRNEAAELVEQIHRLGIPFSESVLEQLQEIEIPSQWVDHASALFVKNLPAKQQILKNNDPKERYRLLIQQLNKELETIHLLNSIKGDLTDKDIQNN